MIQYNMMKEEHEESFDMNSDGKDDYFYNDGQNKDTSESDQLRKHHEDSKNAEMDQELEEYRQYRDLPQSVTQKRDEFHTGPKASITDIFLNCQYKNEVPMIEQLPVYGSSKQIVEVA